MPKTIVGIIMIGGRVGSSMVMRILERSGFNVGSVTQTTDIYNPNGYYEVIPMQHMIDDVFYPMFKGFMPKAIPHNHPNLHANLTEANIKKFEDLFFNQWFSNSQQKNIALKVQYLHPTELFRAIAKRNGYRYIEVMLYRDVYARSNSIKKMNENEVSLRDWVNYFNEWIKVREKHKFDLLFKYEDWFTDPYKNYRDLCNAVYPPKILSNEELDSLIEFDLRHF